MVNPDFVCGLLLIPLCVSCGYVGDDRGPAIILACTLLHFLVTVFKPDPLGSAQRRVTEVLFAAAAGLSIGVLAGGPQEMAIAAAVLAILADIMCWSEGEASSNRVDNYRNGDIINTSNGPILL